jgi:hypothetical protein
VVFAESPSSAQPGRVDVCQEKAVFCSTRTFRRRSEGRMQPLRFQVLCP